MLLMASERQAGFLSGTLIEGRLCRSDLSRSTLFMPIDPCPFKPGDTVDTQQWDATEPPYKRFAAPVRVTMVERTNGCQTGWMVTVVDSKGYSRTLDSAWLLPIF